MQPDFSKITPSQAKQLTATFLARGLLIEFFTTFYAPNSNMFCHNDNVKAHNCPDCVNVMAAILSQHIDIESSTYIDSEIRAKLLTQRKYTSLAAALVQIPEISTAVFNDYAVATKCIISDFIANMRPSAMDSRDFCGMLAIDTFIAEVSKYGGESYAIGILCHLLNIKINIHREGGVIAYNSLLSDNDAQPPYEFFKKYDEYAFINDNRNVYIMDLTRYNSGVLSPLAKLTNDGNTCWWNTLIQCLLATPQFKSSVINAATSPHASPLVKACAAMMQSPSSTNNQIFLNAFRDEARRRKVDIAAPFQQDGTSYGFGILLDFLNIAEVNNMFRIKRNLLLTCRSCGSKNQSTPDVSPYCYAPRDQTINQYLLSTTESTGYRCEKCGRTETTQEYRLGYIGSAIAVCFNKNITRPGVAVPKSLKFPFNDGTSKEYKLVAKAHHSGYLNGRTYESSGHYFASVYYHGSVVADGFIMNDANEIQPLFNGDSSDDNVVFAIYSLM
jgi:hypothetical protein